MSTRTADEETGDETLLEVRNLEKYYEEGWLLGGDPVRAVDGVSFDVHRGETLGVVGESGCGKTTLGRTILGLERATAGEVLVDGTDMTGVSGKQRRQWQRDAQMLFQNPDGSLNDRMTVGEIVREPLDAHGWGTPDERRDRVFDFLDRVGLREEHFYRYPHQFSGGQKQRIGIARALVLEPEFVVLDEPVSALDVSVQARVINLLDRLQEELGLTYLFIAHDLSVVRHIADRVAVMYLGTLVETGPVIQVFEDPGHPYTRALLSAAPGDRARGSLGVDQPRITLRGTPPNPRDPPPGCPFATRCPAKIRPDGIDLTEDAWEAIDEFRAVLRERARTHDTTAGRVKNTLGVSDRAREIRVLRDELFDSVQLPDSVAERIDDAARKAANGRSRAAARILQDEFGGVCDSRDPPPYDLSSNGHESRCLRHDTEYDPPGAVLKDRSGR